MKDSTIFNKDMTLDIDHDGAFKALKGLLGTWVGENQAEHQLVVSYSLHASESVLMEHWQLNETTDALTLYHMDGETLMATHYCPLCNQPRLNLVHSFNGQFGFEFVSATNLTDLEDGHQHCFQIHIIDRYSFWRSETYVGARGFTEGVVYRRD
jgi:hypothetical protein